MAKAGRKANGQFAKGNKIAKKTKSKRKTTRRKRGV